MVKVPTLFLSDEEMGKKYDDHRTDRKSLAATWAPSTQRVVLQHPRRTLKRLGLVVFALFLVYQFVVNIPTDVPIRDRRRPHYWNPDDAQENGVRNRPPPQAGVPGSKAAHGLATGQSTVTYSGRHIKFPALGPTIHAIAETRGSYKANRNVLFAAASLKSVAKLLPVACQMGQELRNYVHFVLMSRDDMDLLELQDINGMDKSCRIMYHDARPDNPAKSTDDRLAEAVSKALSYIHNYMHPQAIIIDNSAAEEKYFAESVKKHGIAQQAALIEMPSQGVEKLSWMTKLDSASLAAWHKATIDILIHATPGASGSLTRLLRSLRSADYSSSHVPQITIDLPHKVDPPTEEFLSRFGWPPGPAPDTKTPRQVSLRHRIASKLLKEDENSVRFLESFWPARPSHSHVLVLSPEAELSPNFFHYLKYTLLEYRYSNAAVLQHSDSRLFGISLISPHVYLNGSGPFVPPSSDEATLSSPSTQADKLLLFLWQAPTNHAMLVLGNKWVELHGLVSQVLDVQGSSSSREAPELLSQKVVSTQFPAWLEHALRLCRAQNYFTLYPGPTSSPKIATVHTELQQPPEEYHQGLHNTADRGSGDDEAVLLSRGPLLDTVLQGQALSPLYEFPLMSWNGDVVDDVEEHEIRAAKYTAEFRRTVGGCKDKKDVGTKAHRLAADLFCTA